MYFRNILHLLIQVPLLTNNALSLVQIRKLTPPQSSKRTSKIQAQTAGGVEWGSRDEREQRNDAEEGTSGGARGDVLRL